MKIILLFILCSITTSCGYIPNLITTAEHVADDTAVSIKVSQEALQRQTNVKATIELDNGQVQVKQ